MIRILTIILILFTTPVIGQVRVLENYDRSSEDNDIFGSGRVVDVIFEAARNGSIQVYNVDYQTGKAVETSFDDQKALFYSNLEVQKWSSSSKYDEGSFVSHNGEVYIADEGVTENDVPGDSWKWNELEEGASLSSEIIDGFNVDIYEKGKKRILSYVNFYARFWGYSPELYAFSVNFKDFAETLDAAGLVSFIGDESFMPFWRGNMIKSEWDPFYDIIEYLEGKLVTSDEWVMPSDFDSKTYGIQLILGGSAPGDFNRISNLAYWKYQSDLVVNTSSVSFTNTESDYGYDFDPLPLWDVILEGERAYFLEDEPEPVFPPLLKTKFKVKKMNGYFSIRAHESVLLQGPLNGSFSQDIEESLPALILRGIRQGRLKVFGNEYEDIDLPAFREITLLEVPFYTEYDPLIHYEQDEVVSLDGRFYQNMTGNEFAATPEENDPFGDWVEIGEPDTTYVQGSNVSDLLLISDFVTDKDGEIVDVRLEYVGFRWSIEEFNDGNDAELFVRWPDLKNYLEGVPTAATYDPVKNQYLTYTDKLEGRDHIAFLEFTEGLRYAGDEYGQVLFKPGVRGGGNFKTVSTSRYNLYGDNKGQNDELELFVKGLIKNARNGNVQVINSYGEFISIDDIEGQLRSFDADIFEYDPFMTYMEGDRMQYEGDIYQAKTDTDELPDTAPGDWQKLAQPTLEDGYTTHIDITYHHEVSSKGDILTTEPISIMLYSWQEGSEYLEELFLVGYDELKPFIKDEMRTKIENQELEHDSSEKGTRVEKLK